MSAAYALILWSWVMAGPADSASSYVDVVGAEVPSALVDKYAPSPEHPEPGDARIPADEPLLPEAIRKIDSWTVITAKGPSVRKVTGISVQPGAGETHLLFWLDGPKIDQGLAVVAPHPKAGPLRKVKARAPSAAVSKRLMKDVLAHVKVGGQDRTALKKKAPGDKDIQVVKVKTAAKRPLTLAFVHIPKGRKAFEGYLSAVAVIAKDGAVTSWVVKPTLDLNKQEPQFLVDPEGDGTDALIIDDTYYEGWYRSMLTFDAKGKVKVQPLTGDGA